MKKIVIVAVFLGAVGAIAAWGLNRAARPDRDSVGANSVVGTGNRSIVEAAQIASSPQVTRVPVRYTDITARAGLRWRYDNGATGQHYFIETTGGGVALFDYNNDGYLDIFSPQGGPVPGAKAAENASRAIDTDNVLYRNNGDGTFTDVTKSAGLDVDTGYGQAVSSADYDNDGWADLYVSAYGGNHLFHNNGNGTFRDVTAKAGVSDTTSTLGAEGEPRWPLSSAWGDYDRDGHLDLFVAHYAHWSPALNKQCFNPSRKLLSYCRPQVYAPDYSRLYHNNGDGTFTDVSQSSKIAQASGKCMGAVWFDPDDDGWLDLFVSSDTLPDLLFHNNRDGTFTEQGTLSGVAVGADGAAMSGMGIGVGDYDNDAREDLFVVNYSLEPKSVLHNLGGGLFENLSYASNIASMNLQYIGFGLEMCDYDLDGWKDVMVGNGHVLDLAEEHTEGSSYPQSQQLLHNQGNGKFVDDLRSLGDLRIPRVTRGIAVGDIDNDGDPDAVMVAHDGPLSLFRNDGGNKSHWITLRLEGDPLKEAVGAKVVIHSASGRRQVQWVRGGSSYGSHSDSRITFGLAGEDKIKALEVRWPDGRRQKFGALTANAFYYLHQGQTPRLDPRIQRSR